MANTAAVKKQRIKAFDLIRGWFLIMIVVNHVELYPDGFDFFTGRGRFFASAAEGFFFMSGLLVGLVYRRRIAQGVAFIFKKMWKRAFVLYLAGSALTLFFAYLAVHLNDEAIKDGLPAVINWHDIIYKTLTLRFAFGWADFLPRFAILMFFAPFVFYAISKGKWPLVIVGSFIAWYFRGTNFIMAWQLIFNLAMVVGFYWNEIRGWVTSLKDRTKLWAKRAIYASAGLTFAFSYAGVYIQPQLESHPDFFAGWTHQFGIHWDNFNQLIWRYSEKWTLGPGRIAFFILWFIALYMLVEKYEAAINRFSFGLLDMLGKNSFFVYSLHAFVIFFLQLLIPPGTNIWENMGFTFTALAAVFTLTAAYRYMMHFSLRKYGLKPHQVIAYRARDLVLGGA